MNERRLPGPRPPTMRQTVLIRTLYLNYFIPSAVRYMTAKTLGLLSEAVSSSIIHLSMGAPRFIFDCPFRYTASKLGVFKPLPADWALLRAYRSMTLRGDNCWTASAAH